MYNFYLILLNATYIYNKYFICVIFSYISILSLFKKIIVILLSDYFFSISFLENKKLVGLTFLLALW